jgi:hypothetical protein
VYYYYIYVYLDKNNALHNYVWYEQASWYMGSDPGVAPLYTGIASEYTCTYYITLHCMELLLVSTMGMLVIYSDAACMVLMHTGKLAGRADVTSGRRQGPAGLVAAAKLGGFCVFLTVQQHCRGTTGDGFSPVGPN